MIIKELQLTHFGKFHHKTISFQEGLNILHGRNEAGKSTIHTFIHCMFYGMGHQKRSISGKYMEGASEHLYRQYEPWEDQGGYGGTLTFTQWGKVYRIERSFLKADPYVRLYNETDGIWMEPAQEQINTLLGDMSETAYRNTVSIGQLESSTDDGLTAELRNHMANLGAAKNVEIDLQRAQDRLLAKKQEMEQKIVPKAQEQRQNLYENLQESEKLLTELRRKEMDTQKQLEHARKQEFDLFHDQKETQRNSEDELERVRDQLNRLEHEVSRWDQEVSTWSIKTGLSRQELEAGKQPKLLGGLMVLLYFIMLGCLGGSVFYLYDFITAAFNGQECRLLYSEILGPGFLTVTICMIVLLLILRSRSKKLDYSYRMYVDRFQHLTEAKNSIETLEKRRSDLRNLLAELDRSEYMRLHEENDRLEKDALRYSWEQEQEQKRWEDLSRELDTVDVICSQNTAWEMEIAALELALNTMYRVAVEIQESFGRELNEKASDYLAILTNGVYQKLVIDEEFRIFLSSQGRLFALDQMSRGTMEQIYFSVRLAASDMLWPEVSMPLLLDDTFAYYDDGRTTEALQLLKRLPRQVIILTCHAREKDMMNRIS